MTLAYAGFPLETLNLIGNQRSAGPLLRVVATVRAECDRRGRCFNKSESVLAGKAGMPHSTFNFAKRLAKTLGIWRTTRDNRRRPETIAFEPQHLWATAEKPPARQCPSVQARLETKSKASFKKKEVPPDPPIADATGGAPSLDIIDRGAEGEPTPQATSTRRTPYGQPRAPRAPRKLRKRWWRRDMARDFLAAAARIEAREARESGQAPPVALAPPQEIITPAEWRRRQQRTPRHPFLEAAEAIERAERGQPPIFDPQAWTLIERNLA